VYEVVLLLLALRAPFLFFIFVREKFAFELVHRAAGFADEPAEVASYLGELARAEDDQKEQADNNHLLTADTEHVANITREPAGINAGT
jgi:hypothetical protein